MLPRAARHQARVVTWLTIPSPSRAVRLCGRLVGPQPVRRGRIVRRSTWMPKRPTSSWPGWDPYAYPTFHRGIEDALRGLATA